MGSDELFYFPISEIAPRIKAREISPVDLTERVLERIHSKDQALNSFITVTADQARKQAQGAEKELEGGNYRGPLHGVPIALKDLFATRGIRTTFASRAFADWVPDFDATVTERLAAAGAILIGKTNLSELAADSSNVNSAFGAPHNPWNVDYITGGSSGGSAAAVAAGLAFGALGSDTAMSIRQPAALCGIVGLKPTLGRVSKYGALALSFSLDHVGPMTRTVADAAVILQAIAGHDPRDPTSVDRVVPDFSAKLGADVKGQRIGVPREDFFKDVATDWVKAADAAINQLTNLGAEIEEITLPDVEDLWHVGSLLIAVECASFHAAKLRESPDSFGFVARSLMEMGGKYTAVQYVQAQRVRRRVSEEVLRALADYDAVTLPTTAVATCRIEEDKPSFVGARTRNTLPFNLLGVPAISVPCGFDPNGVPIGLQFVGRPFGEADLLSLAHAYEQATDWHLQHPRLD